MGPKKQLKNGFYFFVQDYREDQEQLGREMPTSLKDLMAIGAPAWKALGQAEKDRYNARARNVNGKRDKMDCNGRLVKDVEREAQDKKDEESRMIQFIADYITSLGSKEDVSREKFYIISFNIFCKTSNDMYLPAELGLVEFSILEGVIQSYHVFIDPGEIPLGYKYECKEKSERTHKIPWLGFELAEKDYSVVAKAIIDMIDPNHDLPEYPPIFCRTGEVVQNKNLLDMLMRQTSRSVDFAVLDVAQLFYELYCYVTTDMISVGILRDYLQSNNYTYTENTSCDWHWEQDFVEHCSLGIAKRTCFIMCDWLCANYGVSVILSRHYPCSTNDSFCSLTSSSIRSSASSASTLSYNTGQSNSRTLSRNMGHAPSRDMGLAPSRDTSRPSSLFSDEPEISNASYFSMSASPQYRSTSVGDQSAWRSHSRTPHSQSFSDAAAASNRMVSHDFQMTSEDFPGLGKGYGGARPKQTQQQQYMRSVDEFPTHRSDDPRMSGSRNSNYSDSTDSYRSYQGQGNARWN